LQKAFALQILWVSRGLADVLRAGVLAAIGDLLLSGPAVDAQQL